MATTYYYVGPGGDDGNSGLSYALRKETITGILAKSGGLAPGDFIYIAPGTYRGNYSGGNDGTITDPIVFYGDVTGEHTDGIGGMCRLTQLATDTSVPSGSPACFGSMGTYTHWVNLTFDLNLGVGTVFGQILIPYGSAEGVIVDSCVFGNVNIYDGGWVGGVSIAYTPGDGPSVNNTIVRNCIYLGGGKEGLVYATGTASGQQVGFVFENNLMYCCDYGFFCDNNYGYTFRNNSLIECGSYGMRIAGTAGQTSYLYQNAFTGWKDDLSIITGTITSDHNASYNSSLLGGANHINAAPYYDKPLLLQGFKFPNFNFIFGLNDRVAVTKNTSLSAPATDVHGLTRPTGSGKKTPGAIQYRQPTKETTIVRSGTSMKMPDAGRLVYLAGLNGEEAHTFSVSVYREADYAGTLPQMIIKRVGQSDITITDTGAAESWNTLSYKFTPDATDRFAQIEFVSDNTASSGDYAIYIDSFRIKSKNYVGKVFVADLVHVDDFNKNPLDDVWITSSTVVLSPTSSLLKSHLPPYINF